MQEILPASLLPEPGVLQTGLVSQENHSPFQEALSAYWNHRISFPGIGPFSAAPKPAPEAAHWSYFLSPNPHCETSFEAEMG